MKITILTMFPELFGDFLKAPVIRRAMEKELADIRIVDIRDYADGSYRHLDDSTFGGGAGMVMRVQPVRDALLAVTGEKYRGRVIAMTPSGIPYKQSDARRLAAEEELVLVCGHYEGMDARLNAYFDEEISIGDYILTGGELAAQVVTDSVVRLLPGALRAASTQEESFENGLLEYPQYTQPADFEGDRVPEVLLSGDHEKIRKWRLMESLRLTAKRRPDLLENRELTEEERELLERIRAQETADARKTQ